MTDKIKKSKQKTQFFPSDSLRSIRRQQSIQRGRVVRVPFFLLWMPQQQGVFAFLPKHGFRNCLANC
jgi:hypothetical protein